jgi:hypothetical protein
MIAVALLDTLAREADANSVNASSAEIARLAEKYVASSLADWQRVLECEDQVGSAVFVTPTMREAVNRSLYEVYRKWASEAEQVLARTRHLAAHGYPVENAAVLEHAFGRVQARLKLAPDAVEHAIAQIQSGEGIPVGELRDELRARVRS